MTEIKLEVGQTWPLVVNGVEQWVEVPSDETV